MEFKRMMLITAGLAGALGVGLGAFGAHGLENRLSEEMLSAYKTGILYHLIHAVVLAAIAFSGDIRFKKAALFFAVGILLFSFSLYTYSIFSIRFFAMVTPFGGLSFIIGWVMLIAEGVKKK